MTIRSHFVPQFYLRNFGDSLYFYDKTNQSIKQSTPANLALKKNFYGPTDEQKMNPVETAMSRLEGDASSALSEIIKTENYSNLSVTQKNAVCGFVALQYLRTQESRWRVTEVAEKIVNEVAKAMGVTDYEVKLNNDGKTAMHLDIMKGYDTIATLLRNMGVIVFTNDTKIPYWTSDNPIVLNNEFQQFPWGNLGIASKGIEVHLPLTPRLEISFYDPLTYTGLPDKYSADEQGIIRQNNLQTLDSTRFLFSNTDKFYMIDKYLSATPDVKKENKQRIRPGIHEMKPEDFKGKEFHERPEFWIDRNDLQKLLDTVKKT